MKKFQFQKEKDNGVQNYGVKHIYAIRNASEVIQNRAVKNYTPIVESQGMYEKPKQKSGKQTLEPQRFNQKPIGKKIQQSRNTDYGGENRETL